MTAIQCTFITGASGLLGASLVRVLLKLGQAVVGTYHSQKLDLDISLLPLDLASTAEIDRVLEEVRPTQILHCAAATDVDWCETHPKDAHQINVTASGALAAWAYDFNADFVYVSTDAVFDLPYGEKARESDLPNPINTYARTKLLGEQEVLAAHPEALVVRTNIFGWSPGDRRSLAEWVLMKLRENESITGFTDVFFNPLYTDNLSELIVELMGMGRTGIYHMAACDSCSKYEFACAVAERFDYQTSQIQAGSIETIDLRAPRSRNTILDTFKLAEALGRQTITVRDGIERMYQDDFEGR